MSALKVFQITLPVAFAYIFLGMALGILASSNGFSLLQSLAISFFVYSGSAEFLLIFFIVAGESLLGIFVTLFLLSFRHFFYSLSLLSEIRGLNFLRHYVIFALSDESFALLSTYKAEFFSIKSSKKRSFFCALLCFLNQSYWLIGVALGFIFQQNVAFDYSGIEFSLNALFIVLACEAFRQNPNKKLLAIAAIIGLCGFLFIPKSYMLFICLSISLVILLFFKRGKNV
ncbi:branched-chain amino acid ABC transporter permease [Helicobacter saguini]|uniref:Branched-chain amino acid ABC transporter permease n=1 Tax=Helicobacter saguini TaxID=1548018 RepID=A0A347VRC7_9HELI|nr:AzlC family ABC transporter permease [Helicobacter saguini]MWV62949.1 branched-chain amino acid ABC transporter permease [Helicobacter saguini]MWV66380.1 branched-chain amino acid ABC transporter permease [Helicobacter saguini]MWV68733.1 branched-chain amino acid ABC transporter permease [Helicobacter saguini]MWV71715.1 branched-chain amino acid ABC transporter permease [Helicobacter saguini]TLD92160.1 branched-chain amino acid ABC transporter permease [Helicobacter saguini]